MRTTKRNQTRNNPCNVLVTCDVEHCHNTWLRRKEKKGNDGLFCDHCNFIVTGSKVFKGGRNR